MNNIYRNFGLALIAGLAVTALGIAATPSTSPAATTIRQAVIAVKGMACEACAHRLQKVLSALPGANSARVNLVKGEAVINFAGRAKVSDEQIRKTVRDAGFEPQKIEWRHVGASAGGQESRSTTTHAFSQGQRGGP